MGRLLSVACVAFGLSSCAGTPSPAVASEAPRLTQDFTVHVVDVGTGLGVFVEGPDFALVYDAGSNDDYADGTSNRFMAYLHAVKPNLKTLDHVILSHPHRDHVALMPDLIEGYTVKQVWDSGAEWEECNYHQLIERIQSLNVPYRSATRDSGTHLIQFAKACDLGKSFSVIHGPQITSGASVQLGSHSSMTFLYADPRAKERDLNENSLVVRLDLGETRVLLMGDAGGGNSDPSKPPTRGSIEGLLLAEHAQELRADVLVVGHHGSNKSSHKIFLDAVSPQISVISSGPMHYGNVVLPRQDVVEALEKRSPLFRTDLDDDACKVNPNKIGPDHDDKPGGCNNVQIRINGARPPIAAYYSKGD